ncbi:MAG: hypothetical protein WCT85_04405 [Parachlamydiales bacterium]|jgi:hypothetical protein
MTYPINCTFNSVQVTNNLGLPGVKKIMPVRIVVCDESSLPNRIDATFNRVLTEEEKLERRYKEATKLESPFPGSRSVTFDESKMKAEVKEDEDPSPDSFLSFSVTSEWELTPEMVELDLVFADCHMVVVPEKAREGASISRFKQLKREAAELREGRERKAMLKSKTDSVHDMKDDDEESRKVSRFQPESEMKVENEVKEDPSLDSFLSFSATQESELTPEMVEFDCHMVVTEKAREGATSISIFKQRKHEQFSARMIEREAMLKSKTAFVHDMKDDEEGGKVSRFQPPEDSSSDSSDSEEEKRIKRMK